MTPPFLEALGLQADADERAVRRAYARQLKAIDQATQAETFQQLRSHYESALQFVAWRDREAAAAAPQEADAPAPEPCTAQQVEPEATAPADPTPAELAQQAAEEVFTEFQRRANEGFVDEKTVSLALEAALADERMVNLEARTVFEWRVAALIMEGWRPGHEFLFGPACAAFNWETDGRRLSAFGPLGAALDAAIHEKLIFFKQPAGDMHQQRALVRRLRGDEVPAPEFLVHEMPQLMAMAERFPHWMHAITPRVHFARWQEAYEAIPLATREAAMPKPALPQPARPERGSWPGSAWMIVVVAVGLIRLAAFFAGSTSHSPEPGTFAPPLVQEQPLATHPLAPDLDAALAELDKRQREADAALAQALGESPQP